MTSAVTDLPAPASPPRTHRLRRVPSVVVELLRFCVVVFAAAAGYETARALAPDAGAVLGPFDAVTVGLIVGSGLGYAVGGVLGRLTLSAVRRTERTLHERPAEELVTGVVGAVVGSLAGAAASWPVFLLAPNRLALPVLCFLGIAVGLLGYRIGASRCEQMLRLVGGPAGVAPRRSTASALPKIVDTSVAIDGRLVDVVRAGFLHGRMIVTAPVLSELQGLADAGDELRRAKGRRGLELLESLRGERGVTLEVIGDEAPEVADVDAKLVRMCLDRDWALLTLDSNLARVAAVAGVRVLNLHALAQALRPPVVAGDEVDVLLLKGGKEQGQAVGYLDDGTMVVVERARGFVGRELPVLVTSVLTTANGRMVFARPVVGPEPHGPGPRPRSD